jgi:hypothetical protein
MRVVAAGVVVLAQLAAAAAAAGAAGACALPVVVVCHARGDELDAALRSLLAVRGVAPERVLAVQDGSDADVARVARAHGVPLVQNLREEAEAEAEAGTGQATAALERRAARRRHGPGGRIARHYWFALERAFAEPLFAGSPAVVVVEEDLVFAPDLLEFLCLCQRQLEADGTLWLASAWNDNGLAGRARDERRVLRGEQLPGYAWLLPRALWFGELREAWPSEHWDWHLRDPRVSRGREVLFPEVPRALQQTPRSASSAARAAFATAQLHEAYFARMVLASRGLVLGWGDVAAAARGPYDAALARSLLDGLSLRHGSELAGALAWLPATLVLWHDTNPNPRLQGLGFAPLGRALGIWHEAARGAREGVHRLRWGAGELLLVNVFDPALQPGHRGSGEERPERPRRPSEWFFAPARRSRWADLRPPDARVFKARQLVGELGDAREALLRRCPR